MACVLVTRPRAEAAGTAAALAARGYEAILAPATRIAATGARLPAGPFDAVAATSPRAFAALRGNAALPALAALPCFAVGARTAAAAREAGFATVHAAATDRHALAGLIAQVLPRGARLLLPLGRDHHADLAERLAAAGFSPAVAIVYAARAAGALPALARETLARGAVDAVLHYSARSAAILVRLAARAALGEALARSLHVCLSAQVAAALGPALAERVAIADRPDEMALLDRLDAALGHTKAGFTDQQSPSIRAEPGGGAGDRRPR